MTDQLTTFIATLDATGVSYERDGLAFKVEGSLYLYNLTTLPQGISLSAGGNLYLNSLTTLPEGVSLSAGRNLYLNRLTSLPEGVSLSAGGNLDLHSLTTLPEGVSLSAGGNLYLYSLTTLPEGVSLSAGRNLYLNRLTSLPEGVSLSAGGNLDLHSLTTLPEGVSLSAGGNLYLRSMTSETQRYAGKVIRLRTIDYICTRMISSRQIGGVTLWSAQYFKGHLDTDHRCYVAQDGETYAHGDTAEKALADLRFKVMSRDFDPNELIATIKARGTVELNDYRLLTGACESGTRQHLIAHGIDPDTTAFLPLDQALLISRSGYGGETFARMIGRAA